MKRLILLFLLFPHVLTAQWCLNFEDMQLEASFQGRDSAWEITPVEAISGQYSLHHCLDDTISNHDVIASNGKGGIGLPVIGVVQTSRFSVGRYEW